jgi:hypothetical protein
MFNFKTLTIMNEYILNLKNRIKELNVEQKADKLQRKTVKLSVPRTKDPYDAQCDVLTRKMTLRIMYNLYAILRGKATGMEEGVDSLQWGALKRQWIPDDFTC